MEKSKPNFWRPINWKKIANYEITSSWNKSLQAEVLAYIADMLMEGFQMIDIFSFLAALYPKEEETFKAMEALLIEGHFFYETTGEMKLAKDIQFQIQVAECWGDFAPGLKTISSYLKERAQQQATIRQSLRYPVFLVVLLLAMLLGMRGFVLPQFDRLQASPDSGVLGLLFWCLENLPLLLGIFVVALVVFYLLFQLWKRKVGPLVQAQTLVKIPILGRLLRLYYTYYFAYEFSQLFQVGYSIKQIIDTFSQQEEVPFLYDFGHYLAHSYEEGQAIVGQLRAVNIFTREFPAIVHQGELLSQLALKMRLYSQRCLKNYQDQVKLLMRWIQNGLFIVIALFIVTIYLMLMLPMFNMIGEIPGWWMS